MRRSRTSRRIVLPYGMAHAVRVRLLSGEELTATCATIQDLKAALGAQREGLRRCRLSLRVRQMAQRGSGGAAASAAAPLTTRRPATTAQLAGTFSG